MGEKSSVLYHTARGMGDMVRLIEELVARDVTIADIRKTLQNPDMLDRVAEDMRLAETRELERLRSMATVSATVNTEILRCILDGVEEGMADRYGSAEMFQLLLGGKNILRWQAAALCLHFGLGGQKYAKADIARLLAISTPSVTDWLNGGSRSYIRALRDRDRELRFGSLHQYLPVSVVTALREQEITCPLGFYCYYARGGWREEWDRHEREAIEEAVVMLRMVG